MKKQIPITGLALMMFLFFNMGNVSAQYQLKTGVFGSGSSTASNTQYRIKGTAGQTFTGITDNSKYILQTGFWYGSGLVTDAIQTPIAMPQQYQLKQNYPNPFNPGTTIRYNLPRAADVRISIYNMSGRKVLTLVSGKQPAGEHSLYWDASGTASGIYFIKLESEEVVLVKKCLLIK